MAFGSGGETGLKVLRRSYLAPAASRILRSSSSERGTTGNAEPGPERCFAAGADVGRGITFDHCHGRAFPAMITSEQRRAARSPRNIAPMTTEMVGTRPEGWCKSLNGLDVGTAPHRT